LPSSLRLWLTPVLLGFACLLLYSINLGRPAHYDEFFHLLAAEGLLATGEPAIGEDGRYWRGYPLTWLVAQSFALLGPSVAVARLPAMLFMGGALKRQEMLSARLGDVLSAIYLASMVLKHYENQGRQQEDLPMVEWACRQLLYSAQEQLHSFIRNFPNRSVAALMRFLIFPRGRTFSAPTDALTRTLAETIMRPGPARDRLCQGLYTTVEPNNPLGLLQEALQLSESVRAVERKVFDAHRQGVVSADDVPSQIEQAEQQGVISHDEACQLREFDAKVMALIAVDDFAAHELAVKDKQAPQKQATPDDCQ